MAAQSAVASTMAEGERDWEESGLAQSFGSLVWLTAPLLPLLLLRCLGCCNPPDVGPVLLLLLLRERAHWESKHTHGGEHLSARCALLWSNNDGKNCLTHSHLHTHKHTYTAFVVAVVVIILMRMVFYVLRAAAGAKKRPKAAAKNVKNVDFSCCCAQFSHNSDTHTLSLSQSHTHADTIEYVLILGILPLSPSRFRVFENVSNWRTSLIIVVASP